MPPVTVLISRFFPQLTMASRNTSTGCGSARAANKRATMLRIPGPSELERAAQEMDSDSPGILHSAVFTDPAPQVGAAGDSMKGLPKGTFPAVCKTDRSNISSVKSLSENSKKLDSPDSPRSDESQVIGDKHSPAQQGVSQGVSASDTQLAQPQQDSSGENMKQSVSSEPEIVPVLKRKDSSKSRDSRSVSVSEPVDTRSASESSRARGDSKTSSVSSTFSDSWDDFRPGDDSSSTSTSQPSSAVSKRRISFPADSVLTAVIQDGDTPELLRILTGRHGPGLVQRRGKGGVLAGVDVCQTNHVGLTALHHAVLANNLDAAKLLLCHGADVNAQDVHGFSPLHTAAACGFLPLTTLLLVFGADVFSLTLENELPIDVAKELRIVRVLSAEMTRLVQQELWMTSLVRARAEEAWLLVRKVVACVLLFLMQMLVFMRTQWRRHRKTD